MFVLNNRRRMKTRDMFYFLKIFFKKSIQMIRLYNGETLIEYNDVNIITTQIIKTRSKTIPKLNNQSLRFFVSSSFLVLGLDVVGK